jgi:hypothetical protein
MLCHGILVPWTTRSDNKMTKFKHLRDGLAIFLSWYVKFNQLTVFFVNSNVKQTKTIHME